MRLHRLAQAARRTAERLEGREFLTVLPPHEMAALVLKMLADELDSPTEEDSTMTKQES